MGDVVGLNGPTVGEILKRLNEAHAAGDLTHIMVVGLDAANYTQCAFSAMTNERAVWMADYLLQKAREEQR